MNLRVAEAFLAVAGVEARFVMDLCHKDGETMLAPIGVAMVLHTAVFIDPPGGGTEVLLPVVSQSE